MTRTMKDSGIEWIGEIPEDWEIRKIKSVSLFINGYAFKSKLFTSDNQKNKVITIGSFDFQGIIEDKLSFSLEKVKNNSVNLQNNDILIAMSGGTIGKNCFISDVRDRFYVNQRVGILRGKLNKWLSFIINTENFTQYVSLNSESSAQPNISSKDIMNYSIPIPPISEQEKIASILDEKVARIDAIIADTKQSIEELKKYKQSLITETVTKGLDKDVPMKDSGIEWIGKIPEDWEVVKGKYLFDKKDRDIEVEEIVTAFRDGQVVQRKKRRTDGFTNSIKEIGYQGIKKGDLVIHSMDAFAGAIGVSEDDGKSTPVYIVLDKKDANVNNTYYAYLLRVYSYMGYIESMAKGIRVRSTDFKYHTFANTPLIRPSLRQQNEIVDFVEMKAQQIEQLIQDKEELIIQYEEYKKSMIYEYVTGKSE